ncbi:Abortive infection bacteriophage resistance protein [Chlamydia trachomatis]|nr:Abortive infection bacteriophage resistance protein [Chlamydia trachomatis]
MTIYMKPHLSIDEQLQLLEDRGLAFDDKDLCKQVLTNVGYYRLSAYTYPLRKKKRREDRTTSCNYRYDDFSQGHTLDEAIQLYFFDETLRALLFKAIQRVEISLRTNIAYYSGKVDKFIHLDRSLLDPKACSKPARKNRDLYQEWSKNYNKQLKRSKNEDFIRHHQELYGYGANLPIWIAVEILDFGLSTRLFEFLPTALQSQISLKFGFTEGTLLESWLRNLNYMRNLSAHHSRLWNRTVITRAKRPNKNVVDETLDHIANSQISLKRIYPSLSVIAYMLSYICPQFEWRVKLRKLIESFSCYQGHQRRDVDGLPRWLERLASVGS